MTRKRYGAIGLESLTQALPEADERDALRYVTATAVALVLAFASAATQAGVPYRDSVQDDIARFEAEKAPGCGSPALAEALESARSHESFAAAHLQAGDDLGGIIRNASNLLDVGDAAGSHGCVPLAAAVYHYVIGKYVGAAYAALRERAELGLRRLPHQEVPR